MGMFSWLGWIFSRGKAKKYRARAVNFEAQPRIHGEFKLNGTERNYLKNIEKELKGSIVEDIKIKKGLYSLIEDIEKRLVIIMHDIKIEEDYNAEHTRLVALGHRGFDINNDSELKKIEAKLKKTVAQHRKEAEEVREKLRTIELYCNKLVDKEAIDARKTAKLREWIVGARARHDELMYALAEPEARPATP